MKLKDTIRSIFRSRWVSGISDSISTKIIAICLLWCPIMLHPSYNYCTTERICAPLCQQVPYCTLSAKTEWLIPPGANKTISLPWPVAYHTEQNMVVCNVLLAPGAHSQLAISARLEQCIIISNSMKRNSNVGTYLYRGLYAAR